MSDFSTFGTLDLESLIHPRQSGRFEYLRDAFGPGALPEDELFQKGIDEFESDECFRSIYKKHITAGKQRDIIVHGRDIPGKFIVSGIYQNEFPVIGTYIDPAITPGFYYKMRVLDTGRYLFKGKTMPLMSVGLGYGKRITFEGDTHNVNMNYFYSDTHENGVGFSIVALQAGDTFVINDLDGHPIGEGVIDEVTVQKELSTCVEEDKSIVKQVATSFSCQIKHSVGHGLMPLQSEEVLDVSAVAFVVKEKGKKAQTRFIEKIELPTLGKCVFELIQQRR